MPRLNRHTRAGVTLVELLVTLTILGVLGGMLAQLMLNQQRFYQRTAEQSSVRRELRTSMSILPAELRSISSSGGDVTAISDKELQFRGLIGASIVCDKPAAQTIDLPPTDLADNVLTSWYTEPVVGDSLYAFDEGTSRGAEDDTWVPLRITSIVTNTLTCPGAPYTSPVRDVGKRRYRITTASAIPATVNIGAGVRFYRHMRINLSKTPENRWYLSRTDYTGGTWGTPTYFSGPFRSPEEGGLRFTYYDSTGVQTAVRPSISRIDLVLRAEGARGSSPKVSTPPRDSLTFRIALRNRQ